MKNIHILPTPKPSRLHIAKNGDLHYSYDDVLHLVSVNDKPHSMCITNDEEIKEGDWIYSFVDNKIYKIVYSKNNIIQSFYHSHYLNESKKIILTTDQDLIKDGVQAIDDEFLEWFVKNPSCEEIKTVITNEINILIYDYEPSYKIIIPKEELSKDEIDRFFVDMVCNSKEEPKQETLEEAKKYAELSYYGDEVDAFVRGVKWQQEQDKNKYSDEEVIQLLIKFNQEIQEVENVRGWFEQIKKK